MTEVAAIKDEQLKEDTLRTCRELFGEKAEDQLAEKLERHERCKVQPTRH
ncbi:hypothetical protein [Minwuia sp. IMCC3077]|nr:hypothetical protein [Minwuia sp. IMCC3077]